MRLCCPTCGRGTVRGIGQTEQFMLANLVVSAGPRTAQELLGGRKIPQPNVYIHRLRAALEPHGYRIATMPRKKGEHARYRLEKIEGA